MVKRAICYLKFKGGATKKAILKHILKNNLHVKKYTIIARLTNCLGRMLKAKVIKKEKNKFKLTSKGHCLIKYCPQKKGGSVHIQPHGENQEIGLISLFPLRNDENVLLKEESQNLHQKEESQNVHQKEESQNVHRKEESQNVHQLEKSQNVHQLGKSQNVHQLEESQNELQLGESQNVHQLEKSQNVHQLEKSQNVHQKEKDRNVFLKEKSVHLERENPKMIV